MEWEVQERDAENNIVVTDLGGWADLESAIKCANEYMKDNEVEYGIDIKL